MAGQIPAGGSSGGHDCAEALAKMYEFLHSELDAGDSRRIQEHLDECGPCLAQFDLERVVRALVVRSCSNTHAPAELRERVLTRIHQVEVSITRTTVWAPAGEASTGEQPSG